MNQEVSSSTAAFTVCLNAQSNSRVWSLGGSRTVCLLDEEEDEACSSSKELLHSNRSDQILLENYECLRIKESRLFCLESLKNSSSTCNMEFTCAAWIHQCSRDSRTCSGNSG
jgi:hypothetical protein